MASNEHLALSQFIKEIHSSLRETCSNQDAKTAWFNHCKDKDTLQKYAKCMEKLATTHWEENCANDLKEASSRIQWAKDLCIDYFLNESYLKYQIREREISSKLNLDFDFQESFSNQLKLIDVGSCYNPFKIYEIFDVLAIDLCPANNSVKECDFINVSIGLDIIFESNKITQLSENYFDVVTFCFLLEYIPTSELRIQVCQNAYDILKPGGILIISTPDSKHVGSNCKIMKNWRYTLACMGFSRIKYEKLRHMHCMAFRKALLKDTAVRWATMYKEDYMDYSIHIPQDFHVIEQSNISQNIQVSSDDFQELPFSSSSS